MTEEERITESREWATKMGLKVLGELKTDDYMAFFIDHMHNKPSLETIYASLVGSELKTMGFINEKNVDKPGGAQAMLSIIGTIMDRYYIARKEGEK